MEQLHAIFIKEFMNTDVIVLKRGDTMVDAYEKLQANDIHHLPVVDDAGVLIGVFSSTDLNHAYPPRETEQGWYYDKGGLSMNRLEHFMTKDPCTLTPENTLKEAAEIMANMHFGCLPIVAPDSRKLVGIITHADVLKQIAKLF